MGQSTLDLGAVKHDLYEMVEIWCLTQTALRFSWPLAWHASCVHRELTGVYCSDLYRDPSSNTRWNAKSNFRITIWSSKRWVAYPWLPLLHNRLCNPVRNTSPSRYRSLESILLLHLCKIGRTGALSSLVLQSAQTCYRVWPKEWHLRTSQLEPHFCHNSICE